MIVFHRNVPDEFDRATLILPNGDAYEADGHVEPDDGAYVFVYEDAVPVSLGYADVVMGTYAASCEITSVRRIDSGTRVDIKL